MRERRPGMIGTVLTDRRARRKLFCVIAAIGDHTANRTYRLDQLVGNADVADVARRQPDDRRSAQNIRQDMDFCGLTATRKTNGLRLRPPFPPWAERCAFT